MSVVSNVKIYDLEESCKASGYPMRTKIELDSDTFYTDLNRAHRLSVAADVDTGAHETFLNGIRVNFDLTFSNKAWVEAERYRFLEFVSSQSTMHRITKFDLNNQYNEYVDSRIIDIMKEKVEEYNNLIQLNQQAQVPVEQLKQKYLEILYSNPAGFKLTARMTTNYRCLKNIYYQRKNHRLPEWREFCSWIETLPYFNELIGTRTDSQEKV